MEADFWHQRWREGRIEFHHDEVNPRLREGLPALGLAAAARVLVPLCGKSVDLGWLADRGLRPLGVELSPIACAAVFAERGVEPERDHPGALERFAGGGIEVWCGDFLDPSLTGAGVCDALWDRAALIALPESVRPDYVAQCARMLKPGARGLLVTMEYDQTAMEGPPFSVPAAEVRRLYAPHFEVRARVEGERGEPSPHLAERGLETLAESVWLLRRRETETGT